MNNKELYEKYHKDRKLQKRIINKRNFTYKNLIVLIDKYFLETKVLDIGSGVGTIDFYMASNGKNVTGLEVSKTAVKIAIRNSKTLGLKNNLRFKNVNFMNFKSPKLFDCIFISEVLEHLPDDGEAVAKIYSLLKKEGILIASSPSLQAPLYRWGLLDKFDMEVGHLRRYTRGSFSNLFKENGFKIVKVIQTEGVLRNFLYTSKIGNRATRFIRGPIVDFLTILDNLAIKMFGASDIILVARK